MITRRKKFEAVAVIWFCQDINRLKIYHYKLHFAPTKVTLDFQISRFGEISPLWPCKKIFGIFKRDMGQYGAIFSIYLGESLMLFGKVSIL